MERKTLITILAILIPTLIVGLNALAVPSLPNRIGGTITVDGSQLTQSTGTGYTFIVTSESGSEYAPSAQDIDGLNSYGWFTIDIPTFEPNDQPGGARPGDIAIIHVFQNGIELTVSSPGGGRFTIGQPGSYNQIDVNTGDGPFVSITNPTSSETFEIFAETISISGSASSGVLSVTWSNNLGGNGNCNGSTEWSANSIPLYQGENIITVTAENASGVTVTDSITISVFPLSVSPSYLTISIGASADCLVSGGTPPYFVATNETNIVRTQISGNTISIEGIMEGVGEITLTDSSVPSASCSISATIQDVISVGGEGAVIESANVAPDDLLDLNLSLATGGVSVSEQWFVLTATAGGLPLGLFLLSDGMGVVELLNLSQIYDFSMATFSYPEYATRNGVFSLGAFLGPITMGSLGLTSGDTFTYGYAFSWSDVSAVQFGNIVTLMVQPSMVESDF